MIIKTWTAMMITLVLIALMCIGVWMFLSMCTTLVNG